MFSIFGVSYYWNSLVSWVLVIFCFSDLVGFSASDFKLFSSLISVFSLRLRVSTSGFQLPALSLFWFSASGFKPFFGFQPVGFGKLANWVSFGFNQLGLVSWPIGFSDSEISAWGVLPRRFSVSWVFGQRCSSKKVFGYYNGFLLVRFGRGRRIY